jgi:hypothetical protein
MVTDPKEVKKILKEYFHVHGPVKVRSTGVVDVAGTVTLKKDVLLPGNRLPIKFGGVSGSFEFDSYTNLATLEGSPDWVGGTFDCALTGVGSLAHAPQKVDGDVDVRFCNLKNFVGGPQQVGGNYWGRRNDVTSLEGLPEHIPGEFDFELMPGLPILRSLVAHKVEALKGKHRQDVVNVILNKYAGEGKPGALKAAAELVRAGYKEHARW